MKVTKMTIAELAYGAFLLTQVRKVHNTDPNRKEDYKIQLEGAEYIENPYRPVTAVAVFNSDDSRFAGSKPRRGWTTMSASNWEKFFPGTIALSEIAKLEFSSGANKVAPADMKEGVHFLTLGIVNPVIDVHGKKFPLGVVITESLVKQNDQQQPKRNPAKLGVDGLGQIQTAKNQPIYVRSIIDFCTIGADGKKVLPKSTLLAP